MLLIRLALGSILHGNPYCLLLLTLHRHHQASWNTKSTTTATANKLDQPSLSWTLPASASLNRPCCTRCDPSRTTWNLSWNFTDCRVRDPSTKSASERVSSGIILHVRTVDSKNGKHNLCCFGRNNDDDASEFQNSTHCFVA